MQAKFGIDLRFDFIYSQMFFDAKSLCIYNLCPEEMSRRMVIADLFNFPTLYQLSKIACAILKTLTSPGMLDYTMHIFYAE